MPTIREEIFKQPIFSNLKSEYIDILESCALKLPVKKGEFIFKAGDEANNFYLICSGKVALELFTPERGTVKIQTLIHNDILGWSWLFPPYRWHFDAQAIEDTELISFDGKYFLEYCRRNHEMGYYFLTIFSGIMLDRLQETRLRLLDFYGPGDIDV